MADLLIKLVNRSINEAAGNYLRRSGKLTKAYDETPFVISIDTAFGAGGQIEIVKIKPNEEVVPLIRGITSGGTGDAGAFAIGEELGVRVQTQNSTGNFTMESHGIEEKEKSDTLDELVRTR